MPPNSLEKPYNNNIPESGNMNLPEYQKLERGDVDFNDPALQNQKSDNQPQNSQSQQDNQLNPNQAPIQQARVDPVELVKGMISNGFTPSQAQIMNASTNINGPVESSNTWFAVFLKRIINQKKAKAGKK